MRRTIDEEDLQMKMSPRFAASTALALIMRAACFGQHYTGINLVSNTLGIARVTDPRLINIGACLGVPALGGGYPTKRLVLAGCLTDQEPSGPSWSEALSFGRK